MISARITPGATPTSFVRSIVVGCCHGHVSRAT
jgi:hypothetical protein